MFNNQSLTLILTSSKRGLVICLLISIISIFSLLILNVSFESAIGISIGAFIMFTLDIVHKMFIKKYYHDLVINKLKFISWLIPLFLLLLVYIGNIAPVLTGAILIGSSFFNLLFYR